MKFKRAVMYTALVIAGSAFFSCGGNEDTAAGQMADRGDSIPVEVTVIKSENLQKNISFSGVMQPIHSVDLLAEVSGKIVTINKKIGDMVSTQDILAEIDDEIPLSNFKQAKSTVLSAENNLKIAQLNLKSDEELFASGDISKLAYENASLTVKTAEANHLLALANLSRVEKAYRDTRIKSPINGYISRKYIDVGTMVNLNTPLYRVVDLSALKMSVGVPQEVVPLIRPGSPASVTVSAYSEERLSGEVRYISPQADEMTGAFNVEIHIKNRKADLIPAGMAARVEILLDKKEGILALPAYAIMNQDGQPAVFKVENNRAVRTSVAVGESIENKQIVKSGLAIGDTVVTVGIKNLDENDLVEIERIE